MQKNISFDGHEIVITYNAGAEKIIEKIERLANSKPTGRPRTWTDEQYQLVQSMRDAGKTRREITKELCAPDAAVPIDRYKLQLILSKLNK